MPENAFELANLRVCLASSPGGHLAELESLTDGLDEFGGFLVTVKSPHTTSAFPSIRKLYVRRVERNPANLVANALASLAILLKEKPDVVISTGAGDMVPLMILSACLGIPVVFAESVARIDKPSLTGRLVRRWTRLIMIPWASLKHAYPDAVSVAPLVSPGNTSHPLPPDPSILILTGTGPRGFDRLLRTVDALVQERYLTGQVYAQIGTSSYLPQNFRYARFIPHASLIEAIQSCDVVITHCGAGSIREALKAGKITIVVPRKPREGEVAYRSNAELARHLASLGWVTIAENPTDIPRALANHVSPATATLSEAEPRATEVLAAFLRTLRLSHRGAEPSGPC